ncbi:replication initiation protein [Corynebacterium sp. HMSC076C10]|uniref:replication initiation protein n=1 Tax=Corynebacterium sp. HMSC076C10 TaxID=1739361 RepID=UPI001AEF5B9E|nr:replication initiation protein [Corynebacterium sp. HMSC076C10]
MTAPTDRPDGKFEQLWLPLWPLASDNLRDGIYRTSRQKALGKRFIEANPDAISNLLVVDIDHDDALIRAMWDREQWRSNAVVENPTNGHAHAVWALEARFARTEYAHRAPLAYAAAVTEGLRRSVDGDTAYSGLMTKTPSTPAGQATGSPTTSPCRTGTPPAHQSGFRWRNA